jgi:hypothetical protein
MRERSLFGMLVPLNWGWVIHDRKQEKVRCASRRLLR